MGKYPGWRHMTASERYNAKAEAMFEDARKRGVTGLASKRVTVTLELPGSENVAIIGRFWTVQEAEEFLGNSPTVDPNYLVAGYYSIDAPEEMINPPTGIKS